MINQETGRDSHSYNATLHQNNYKDVFTFSQSTISLSSEPNNFNAYSDINRDGSVGPDDLSLFTSEWLWDADDPNTW